MHKLRPQRSQSKTESPGQTLVAAGDLAARGASASRNGFLPRAVRWTACLVLILVGASLSAIAATNTVELADLVDPRIGQYASGATVIGPTLPHGSIHPSPDTPNGGNDGYDPTRPIRGFSQLHPSGTGWGRYGNLLISPQIGLAVKYTEHDSPKADEKATAYSYQVRLTKYGILSELAPTRHAAIYRFTFPAGDAAHLMLDLAHSIPGDINTRIGGRAENSVITYDPEQRCFTGSSTYYGGWGGGRYTVYFYAEVDQEPSAVGTWKNEQSNPRKLSEQWTTAGDRVGGWLRFSAKAGHVLQLKLGVSFRSVERARELLQREIPGWEYAAVCEAGRQVWNETLGRIAVDGGSETQRIQFYTALYHAQIMPRDRTGEFERFPAEAPMWDDHYAIWDTWRTKYPLMVLIQPGLVRGTIASFIERLRVDGQVRDSITAGCGKSNQRDQGGNDADNIIADAYVKGLQGVDWEKAYAVLQFNADKERRGNVKGGDYQRQGWIRAGIMSDSDTLEYAYNDFAIAQVARGLGKKADAAKYFARARQWQNLFNPAAACDGFKGFIMPRENNGTWVDWDAKKFPGSWALYFYEANSWTYSFFAPHQTGRLVELMGGKDRFVERLDYAHEKGLIGFGNEPGFLAPFLFHYAGRPDLSSKWVRRFVTTKFNMKGYPGDDDSGAMSSYYVWASIGLFPNAGQDIYFLNGPLFDRVVVQRPDEGRLEITRAGTGDYVAAVTLNGKSLDRSWVQHGELKGDTVLAFSMSETPTQWGTQRPPPSDLGSCVETKFR